MVFLEHTLKLPGILVRSPMHPQQKLCQLLEARTPPTWVVGANAQERPQDEQVLPSLSAKLHQED